MTGFDFIVLGVVILSGIFAYSRGFVREALSIASWVLAAAAAYYAGPSAVPLFDRFLPRGAIANLAAAAAIFIVALIVLHIIAKMLAGRVKHSALSPVDRSLGLLFGLVRGLVLVCIGYLVLAWVMPPGSPRPHWFADSRSAPYLQTAADRIEHYLARSHAGTPQAGFAVESEAEKAISAFAKPAAGPSKAADPAPAYSPDEQRDLNRLIEQQNAK